MKPLTINKASWHYRLATVYGPMSRYNRSVDICVYTRSVIVGVFACLLIVAVTLLMTTALAVLVTIAIDFPMDALIGVIVTMAVVIVALLARALGSREPGPVRLASRSWRDKYCVPVEFTESK